MTNPTPAHIARAREWLAESGLFLEWEECEGKSEPEIDAMWDVRYNSLALLLARVEIMAKIEHCQRAEREKWQVLRRGGRVKHTLDYAIEYKAQLAALDSGGGGMNSNAT